MLCGHIPGGVGNSGVVGDDAKDHVPDDVRDHKAKSTKNTKNVMVGTLVSGLGLDVLEPCLEVGSRAIGEGVGKGNCRVSLRHGGWVDGWMDGWVKI